MTTENKAIIDALIDAYNAELETVMNYIANATDLDGIRAKHISAALQADVAEELGHAQLLARRIKTIGGRVPGSLALKWNQKMLQPPSKSTDVLAVIKGVVDAENQAIDLYNKIIKLCDGMDFATQDMAITILGDEQEHRREFVGFLKEYESTM